jgi:RNA polymerase sigma factor (sigma-70 family)
MKETAQVVPGTEVGLLQRLGSSDDNDAWALFRARYKPLICSVARQAGLSEGEADEVLQSTLIAVHRSLGDYDRNRAKFRTWLGGIVRNRIREQLRNRPQGEPQVAPPAGASTVCTSVGASTLLEAGPFIPFEEEDERVLDAMAWERFKKEVSPQHWQVLHELVGRGRNAADVAEMFGLRRGHVDVIKWRHLKKLEAIRRQVQAEDEKWLWGNAPRSAAKDALVKR